MSHTNTTANYNLPQFVGTDKPSWLTDVNGAMTGIDTQMKANADAITTTAGDLSTLAGRVTTAEGNISSQAASIQTVSGVASNASTTATNANTKVDGLTAYLTMSDNGDITPTVTGGTASGNTLRYASNADGSAGKVYGNLTVAVTSAGGATIVLPTPFRPTSGFNVQGNCLLWNVTDKEMNLARYAIDTSGNLTLTLSSYFYNKTVSYQFIASMMFWSDFGD